MTDSDYLSRLMLAERGAAPPSGAADAGLRRLLESMATQAAPLPVAVGSLKLGWALLAKWVGVGLVVGAAGAGAATYASNLASSSTTVRPALSLSAAPAARAGVGAAGISPAPSAPSAPSVTLPNGSKPELTATAAALVPSVTPAFDEELRLIAGAGQVAHRGLSRTARRGRRHWKELHRAPFGRVPQLATERRELHG